MSLAATLRGLCPVVAAAGHNTSDGDACGDYDADLVLLRASDGGLARCHGGVLRARCPLLAVPPQAEAPLLEVAEESAVLQAVLLWVYSEQLVECTLRDSQGNPTDLCPRLHKLATLWGLRDTGCLQDRLSGRRLRTGRRAGSLAADLLAGYRAGLLGGRLSFRCPRQGLGEQPAKGGPEAPPEAPPAGQEDADEEVVLLPAGLTAVLRSRSTYFAAMLGGDWAESSAAGCDRAMTLDICWPSAQLARVLEFLHGGTFIESESDLKLAVDCAAFFGVPALVAHVNDWIAEHLELANASALWRFVNEEPNFRSFAADDEAADADVACFDFHVRHFDQLAAWLGGIDSEGNLVFEEGGEPPLHKLSLPLLRRLLMSGLIDMGTQGLTFVVERFLRAHCPLKQNLKGSKLLASLLPPEVLFNQEHKTMLLRTLADVSVMTVL